MRIAQLARRRGQGRDFGVELRHAFPLAYLLPIRRVLYTTNAIENLHMQLRKAPKTRGHFPNDEAALELIYLVLRKITACLKQGPRKLENKR
jgi:transposase-like protein